MLVVIRVFTLLHMNCVHYIRVFSAIVGCVCCFVLCCLPVPCTCTRTCSYNVLKLCRCNEMAFTLAAALLKRLAIVELEIHAFCENQHEIMIFLLVAVVVFFLFAELFLLFSLIS